MAASTVSAGAAPGSTTMVACLDWSDMSAVMPGGKMLYFSWKPQVRSSFSSTLWEVGRGEVGIEKVHAYLSFLSPARTIIWCCIMPHQSLHACLFVEWAAAM